MMVISREDNQGPLCLSHFLRNKSVCFVRSFPARFHCQYGFNFDTFLFDDAPFLTTGKDNLEKADFAYQC